MLRTAYEASLQEAIFNSDIDGVQAAIRSGAQPLYRDGLGRTALHLAVSIPSPSIEIILSLLPLSDVSALTDAGESALFLSVSSRNKEIITLLAMQPGTDFSQMTEMGVTLFRQAMKNGMDEVLFPCAAHDFFLFPSSEKLKFACFIALRYSHAALMMKIVEFIHIPTHKDAAMSACVFSIQNDNVEILRALFEKKVSVNYKISNRSLMAVAMESKSHECFLFLINQPEINVFDGSEEMSLLQQAAILELPEFIYQVLVKTDLKKDALGMKHAFKWALRLKDEMVINIILEHLKARSERECKMFYPVHEAISAQDVKTLGALMEIGWSTAQTDENMQLPLTLACAEKKPEMIRLLFLNKSTCLNKKDIRGVYPLDVVKEKKDRASFLALVQSAHDFFDPLVFKEYLNYAIESEDLEAIHMVAKKGGKFFSHDAGGFLSRAIELSSIPMAEAIFQYFSLYKMDELGGTPLVRAANSRNEKMILLVISKTDPKEDVKGIVSSVVAMLHLKSLEILRELASNKNIFSIMKGKALLENKKYSRQGLSTESLNLAIELNEPGICLALLQQGVSLNNLGTRGLTPLMCAIQEGKTAIALAFLGNKIADDFPDAAVLNAIVMASEDLDINARDLYGRTALTYCANNTEVFSILILRKDIDFSTLDFNGKLAFPYFKGALSSESKLIEAMFERSNQLDKKLDIAEPLCVFLITEILEGSSFGVVTAADGVDVLSNTLREHAISARFFVPSDDYHIHLKKLKKILTLLPSDITKQFVIDIFPKYIFSLELLSGGNATVFYQVVGGRRAQLLHISQMMADEVFPVSRAYLPSRKPLLIKPEVHVVQKRSTAPSPLREGMGFK